MHSLRTVFLVLESLSHSPMKNSKKVNSILATRNSGIQAVRLQVDGRDDDRRRPDDEHVESYRSGFRGYLTYSGEITVGAFVAYFLYVDLFLQPIRRLMQFAQQYEDGMSGFERFVEIMETKSSITDSPDAVELNGVRGDIRVEKVSFAYDGGENVLTDINLHIPAGKMVALVGPSGGGKTTLCHLIPRFYDVKVDGSPLTEWIFVTLPFTP